MFYCSSIFPFDVWDKLWALIRPDPEVSALIQFPFELHTDASFTDRGAVLYKGLTEVGKTVAYASRNLKPFKKKYVAYKLVFLALRWAVKTNSMTISKVQSLRLCCITKP